jgi:hypothetical protein
MKMKSKQDKASDDWTVNRRVLASVVTEHKDRTEQVMNYKR